MIRVFGSNTGQDFCPHRPSFLHQKVDIALLLNARTLANNLAKDLDRDGDPDSDDNSAADIS
jgi:hypothetical protein